MPRVYNDCHTSLFHLNLFVCCFHLVFTICNINWCQWRSVVYIARVYGYWMFPRPLTCQLYLLTARARPITRQGPSVTRIGCLPRLHTAVARRTRTPRFTSHHTNLLPPDLGSLGAGLAALGFSSSSAALFSEDTATSTILRPGWHDVAALRHHRCLDPLALDPQPPPLLEVFHFMVLVSAGTPSSCERF